MEHRWGHRREISRIVHLESRSGVATRGRMSNVSISGAFVVSPLPARLYSYVQVQFSSIQHNGTRSRMSVEAQVVRKERGGFGIEWCEFNPEAIQCLSCRPAELPQAAYR
jgi:hypothetical protein